MSEVAVSRPDTLSVAVSETVSLLNIIAQAATNPNVDVAKLQALLDMQRQVRREEAEAAFNHALARLSADMPRVKKNGTIKLIAKDGQDKGSIPFARWEDVDDVIRPLMRQEGFTLSFDMPDRGELGIRVTGTLLHRDGHSKTATILLPQDNGPGRGPLQAIGSTLSYGRRYCAEMLLNIVREGVDDDGQAGSVEYITPDEAEKIRGELVIIGAQEGAFAKHMGVGTIEQIKAGDFRKALNALSARRQEKGK